MKNTNTTHLTIDTEKKLNQQLDDRFQKYCESYSTAINAVEVAGFEFLVYPNVYRGESASTTAAMLKTFTEFTNLKVLDMGCGTGVLGILASLKGASRVVMADIHPKAVENTQANIDKYNIQEKCEVNTSDLFSSVVNEKFDLVLFNMPFLYGEKDAEEPALKFPEGKEGALPPMESFVDEGYQTIRRFFTSVKDYLNPTGVIRCTFASFGNYEALDNILKDNGLTRKTIAVQAEEKYGLEYLALEISPV